MEGKFAKLVDAKVLLRCALFIDVLAEAKKFSLITQKSDVDIITIIDYVESTKYSYERLLKWLRKNSTNVFKLPTVKLVVEAIESNEDDGEPLYQNQKVHYYIREKRYIENHIVEIVESIISCFERRYGNLYSDASDAAVNVNANGFGRMSVWGRVVGPLVNNIKKRRMNRLDLVNGIHKKTNHKLQGSAMAPGG